MSVKKIGVYVDLDCLLDTRFATLLQIDREKAIEFLEFGSKEDEYFCREIDDFDGFDYDEYRQAYQKRSVETLKLATITNLILFLKKFVFELNAASVKSFSEEGTLVTVNYYPYELSDFEKEELIKVIKRHLLYQSDVKLISRPLIDLDCLYVNNNFDYLFIYDYIDWLNYRQFELLHKQMPDKNIYGPMIYVDHIPDDDDINTLTDFSDKVGTDFIDHFKLLRDTYNHVIKINHVPIDYYCMVNTYGNRFFGDEDDADPTDNNETPTTTP